MKRPLSERAVRGTVVVSPLKRGKRDVGTLRAPCVVAGCSRLTTPLAADRAAEWPGATFHPGAARAGGCPDRALSGPAPGAAPDGFDVPARGRPGGALRQGTTPISRVISSTRSLKEQTWDDSVKSLVEFPEVLSLMDQKLDWVQKLGDAFLGQQKELLDAVQRLVREPRPQGNLSRSTPQQTVTVEARLPRRLRPGRRLASPPPPQTVVGPTAARRTVITIPADQSAGVYVPSLQSPGRLRGTAVSGGPAVPTPTRPATRSRRRRSLRHGHGGGSGQSGVTATGTRRSADVNVNNYNSYFPIGVNRSTIANERVSHYEQGQGGNRQQGQGGIGRSGKHNPGEPPRCPVSRPGDTAALQPRGHGQPAGHPSREAFRGRR